MEVEKALTPSKSSQIQKKCSKTIELKVLDPAGGKWGRLQVARNQMADQEKSLLASLNMMIAHAAGMNQTPKVQMLMLREAMKRYKVTCEEAIEAFLGGIFRPMWALK